jgi:hypothetical protein
MTLASLRLSLLQDFKGRRNRTVGVLPKSDADILKWPASSNGLHIKCDLGPVGLIQLVVSCGQGPYDR